ncbi:MAG: arsenic efflux protein [Clostridiales bacterium]|nr:arsenic efflux protein [Clostridiales bacterium]
MGEVFLDAFLDTLKVLPFLLIMNFIIELLEYRSNGLKMQKALNGGFAPLIGGCVGIVPQCGFSVVATELYTKRKIALGTLLAVYIATSDEALPIMLSDLSRDPAVWTKILPVMIIKLVFALIVGYAVFAVQKLMQKQSAYPIEQAATSAVAEEYEQAHEHDHEHEHDDNDRVSDEGLVHIHGCHHHALDGEDDFDEKNATKAQKAKRVFDLYFKHPLLHTATVIFFIFVVNVVFGTAVYYVGENRIAAFIGSTGYFQPLLAGAVGLIPNCAASVVITELYMVGGLSLGGAVAGLSVGAGIGYAVLAKQNKSVKNTVFIIVLMYVISVALGMIINAIPWWF